jgi:hypothetical protein
MPQTSDRKRAIDEIETELYHLQKAAVQRELLDEEDSLEDEHHLHLYNLLNKMKSSCYLFCLSSYRKN